MPSLPFIPVSARSGLLAALLALTVALAGCSDNPRTASVDEATVVARHSPIVATDTDEITVTAEVDTDAGDYFVFLFVDGSLRESCDTTPTCSVTVGPLSASEPGGSGDPVIGRPIEYEAIVLPYNYTGCTLSPCYVSDVNIMAITGPDYLYGTTTSFPQLSRPVIPALLQAQTHDAIDVVFHQASDYDPDDMVDTFLAHVEDKIYDIYLEKELIAENFELMNFYVYTKVAEAGGCGTLDPDIATDATYRDVDAVLHLVDLRDCANGSRFSAEGGPTKAFLHESGHAVFGLADEYDGTTNYFEPAVEPNIWAEESDCRAEQTANGRAPGDCSRFTTRQGGWWKSHAVQTVMRMGFMSDPWGAEGEERVEWVFSQQ